MAMRQLLGGAWVPTISRWSGPAFNGTPMRIDASGEKMAYIFRAPKTGTLHSFEFKCGSATQTPGSNGVRASFQDVDLATGNPDETADQFRTLTSTELVANAWVIPPGPLTSDGTDNGAKRSVVRGELLAVVLEYNSFQASSVVTVDMLDVSLSGGPPYADLKTGGSWAKVTLPMTFAIRYDDGTYPMVIGPYGQTHPTLSISSNTTNNGTTPDEIGMTFTFPANVLIGGAYVRVDLDGDCDLLIYDSQGTVVVGPIALDKDVRTGTTGTNHMVIFPEFVALANELYTLALRPSSATSATIYWYTVNDANKFSDFEGGTSWYWRERTDAGAWTETLTKRPYYSLLVSGLDQECGGQPDVGFTGIQ